MGKLTFIAGLAAGYVLGARAGRQRYEQLRGMAMKVKSNPKVQSTAQKAAETAKEAAPVVKDKVVGAAGAATQKVRSDSSDTTNGVPMDDSAYPKG